MFRIFALALRPLRELVACIEVEPGQQLSVRVDDLTIITDAMALLRARPPGLLGGQPVAFTDLLHGSDHLPPTDAVRMDGESLSVVVRPSGTEPKLKCYFEARLPPPDSADMSSARQNARSMVRMLRAELANALGLPTTTLTTSNQ